MGRGRNTAKFHARIHEQLRLPFAIVPSLENLVSTGNTSGTNSTARRDRALGPDGGISRNVNHEIYLRR
jgi:hypothetical protein